MKLLLLIDDFAAHALSPPGLWLSDVARWWAARSHRVTVICTRPQEPDLDHEPDNLPGVKVWRPSFDDLDAVIGEELSRLPDVVHLSAPGPFGPRVVESLHESPLLLDVHDFWPICPNSDLLRRPRLEPCGEHYPYQGCGACAGLSRLRAMEEKVELAAAARLVLAHSNYNRVRLNAGLERAVELIGYGVDTLRFRSDPVPPTSSAVARLYETRGRPRVMFLGPPTAARGAGILVDLMVALEARLPEVELVIAGRDPENPDWENVFRVEAAEMGLSENAVILPRVPPLDLPALYASCQVAIAPGTGHEPGGLFLLQALATGLPVVAHPDCGHEEWVHQGEEGLLVHAGEVSSFAVAVAALLIDPYARSSFGDTGRLQAIEHHDLERSMRALEELYGRLTASPGMSAVA